PLATIESAVESVLEAVAPQLAAAEQAVTRAAGGFPAMVQSLLHPNTPAAAAPGAAGAAHTAAGKRKGQPVEGPDLGTVLPPPVSVPLPAATGAPAPTAANPPASL